MKHLKETIVAKVHECLDKAHTHWPHETFKFPNIRFDKRGQVAGTANGSKWELNFNMVLCEENTKHFIAQTVPHEVAHLLDHQVYDSHAPRYDRMGRRMKRASHGVNWKRCMKVLGVPAIRCHDYDVTNAKVRKSKTFKYECSGCRTVLELGAVRHKKQQSGQRSYSHTGCRGAKLQLIK